MLPSPHLHLTTALFSVSFWIRITVTNLTLALHPCHKINKSITVPHMLASITTWIQIVSSHMSVSLLNILPSMPKLLESTSVTIVSQCRWSAHANMKMLSAWKEPAPLLRTPLAVQEAFWIVGVLLHKANTREDHKPESSCSTLISMLWFQRMQQVHKPCLEACSCFMKLFKDFLSAWSFHQAQMTGNSIY